MYRLSFRLDNIISDLFVTVCMQRRLKGKLCGDGGGSLEAGSMVLARYSIDKEIYRAKVEEVKEMLVR